MFQSKITITTTGRLRFSICLIAVLGLSACGGSSIDVNQSANGAASPNGSGSTIPPVSLSSPVPAAVQNDLNTVCNTKPSLLTVTYGTSSSSGAGSSSGSSGTGSSLSSGCQVLPGNNIINCSNSTENNSTGQVVNSTDNNVNGQVVNSSNDNNSRTSGNTTYTEVLSQQDEGNVIQNGTSLNATNLVGTLYVEPSTDGNVTWAARKWVMSDTQADADGAMKNIQITSTVDTNEAAEVTVSYPTNQFPPIRYETCVVVQAPADWIANLNNDSGLLQVVSHGIGAITANTTDGGEINVETASTGTVTLGSDFGDITLNQTGTGADTVTTSSGTIIVTTASTGTVTLGSDSDVVDITLTQTGTGADTVKTLSGTINVTTASTGSVTLGSDSDVGDITLTQTGTGADTVKTLSGTINVTTASTGSVALGSDSDVGDITLTQTGTGPITLQTESGSIAATLSVPSQANSAITSGVGDITLTLSGDLAANLNAQVNVGTINVPAGFPQPAVVNTVGATLVGALNGGGSLITLTNTTGEININATGSFVSAQ